MKRFVSDSKCSYCGGTYGLSQVVFKNITHHKFRILPVYSDSLSSIRCRYVGADAAEEENTNY